MTAPFAPPLKLSRRITLFAALIRRFYFRRVDVVGAPLSAKPTLFIASHRNGGADGSVYAEALGDVPSLVSVQLLRSPFLRLFINGIPVVRNTDRARYGIRADAVPSPLAAGIAQICAGGSLCLYPEGTSKWQPRPQPYLGGMGVMAAKLKAAGADFVVQPLGVFYSKPDGFRSRVSIVTGEAFYPQANGVKALQAELADALDRVSVCCADVEAFNAAQSAAWQAVQNGEDFGAAFLVAQETGCRSDVPPPSPPVRTWAKILFAASFPLPAAAALWAQCRSDGRNNVSFLRVVGGVYGALFQVACWLTLLLFSPAAALLWLAAGVAGWYFYPEPLPIPLTEADGEGTA